MQQGFKFLRGQLVSIDQTLEINPSQSTMLLTSKWAESLLVPVPHFFEEGADEEVGGEGTKRSYKR